LDVNTFVAGDVLAELAQAAGIRDSIGARQFQTNTAAAAAESATARSRQLRALSWDREAAGDRAFETLEAFDVIARDNDGSRSVENGYDASGQYVMSKLDELPNIEYIVQTFRVAVDDWSGVFPGADPKIPTLSFATLPDLLFKGCDTTSSRRAFALSCDYAGVRYGGYGDYNLAGEEVRPICSVR
jgi:hypothetical protein